MQFIRPMKAENAVLSKIQFPVLIQPKVDGVRGLVVNGQLRTRTLRPFGNKFIQRELSRLEFSGFDGELYLGSDMCSPSLCRDTTSALNSYQGEPKITFMVFDDISPGTIEKTYLHRLKTAKDRVKELAERNPSQVDITLVQCAMVETLEELEVFEAGWLARGAEGIILRDPYGLYKNGRSTVREGGFLRIKRFADMEVTVIDLIEAQENQNEAVINHLGYTERSSHQDFKVGKGMVGALTCKTDEGQIIRVGPGNLTEGERILYWHQPERILNKRATIKYFPHGMLNAPRFPTFKHLRENDI